MPVFKVFSPALDTVVVETSASAKIFTLSTSFGTVTWYVPRFNLLNVGKISYELWSKSSTAKDCKYTLVFFSR